MIRSFKDRVCSFLGYIELYLSFRGLTILDSTLNEVNISLQVTTTKDDVVYVHVLDFKEETLEIPGFESKVKSAVFFDDDSKAEVKKTKEGIIISLPAEKRKPIDTIVVLTLK